MRGVGRHAAAERQAALKALRDRDINILFAVDLFNEGLDIPEVDTVLFLRPTESATVFCSNWAVACGWPRARPCSRHLISLGTNTANSASTNAFAR